jgi:hypothetical protein
MMRQSFHAEERGGAENGSWSRDSFKGVRLLESPLVPVVLFNEPAPLIAGPNGGTRI